MAVLTLQAQRRADRWLPPQQGKGNRERERAKQKERPSSSPTRTGAIGDVSEERVVDVVPGASYENGRCRDGRVNPDHIGQENGEVGADNGAGQTEAYIPQAVNDLLPASQLFVGGSGPSSQ